jgi:catechol 2,3-dioxygenase-like lactoylglutathione lyase family enzyme
MVRHVAGVGEIVDDVEAAVRFYREALGLEVEHEPGSDYADVKVPGILHYGLWARPAAAESIYGDRRAAERVPLGFCLGFEVDDVEAGHRHLTGAAADVVQGPQTEPWGQRTTRFVLPSGLVSELSETPWARRLEHNVSGAGEAS